jgi:Ca2+-binding RTX toxin-like protein
LSGRGGNDTYLVDTAADVIAEAAGGGFDTLTASSSYALAAGVEVERLTTYGSATTTPVNLTGNEFAQTLYGNAGANTLNGGGGVDQMFGYGADDRYFVDNAADRIEDTAGSDSVIATASYVLDLGVSVETLRTLGSASTYAVDLTGNELVNTVQGNAAVNRINGGRGSDSLFGGGEDDTFVFDTFFTAGGPPNIDTVTDFNVADDTVELDDVVFGLPLGVLAASAFRIGTAAADRDDRIIYDPATGALMFDANGTLSGGPYQFATLSRSLALTNADFVVA